jgi:hypothetical protein
VNVHLYRPSGADRVAVVSMRPAASGEGVVVLVSRGKSRKALGTPVSSATLDVDAARTAFAGEVAKLKTEGFLRSGLGTLLTALDGKNRKKRALAARRLGWMRELGAVEALLAVAPKATDELPVIVDALGEIGDPRAIALCRTIAEKKLLSRRRSGVEALRKLDDPEGLAAASVRAMERLPDTVRATLGGDGAPGATVAALAEVSIKDRGLAIDSLYELGTPVSIAAAREAMVHAKIDAPHVWRYVKSVFKRSMLRHDVTTFGWLAHGIEAAGRESRGTTATVKSGYDGESRETRIFGRATQAYLRRAAWRYLRMLAKHRPSWYAYAAAETIVHYSQDDEIEPAGRYGAYSRAYLLHRVLWGNSQRYELVSRKLQFRLRTSKSVQPVKGVREEAFPELWDAEPRAYLRLLGGARLPVVHEMALTAVRRAHMDVVRAAAHHEIVALLGAPYPATVDLGLDELRRRFDPAAPDWTLLGALVVDARATVRTLGLEWLSLTRDAWATDPVRVLAFLGAPDAEARAAVAGHVLAALETASADARADMAAAVLGTLSAGEPAEGAHDQHGRIAEALAAEISRVATLVALMAMLQQGSPAAQSVAARALATKDGAAEALGVGQLEAMADHELVALREASHALLRRLLPGLRVDPSPLYSLLESRWDDTRRFAADVVRDELDTSALSPDALLGLCDSNRTDVQDLGRALVERHFSRLDAQLLVKRLAEHPHRHVRAWAVELAVRHLKDGYVALAGLEEFFRTVVLDVSPDRKAKRAVIAFLTERGLRDERQAEVACRLLGELGRSKTKDDAERAVSGLARIKVRFPDVAATVTLREAAR